MTQMLETRRSPDGAIDFDHYRAEARAMRKQAQRDAMKVKRFRLTLAAAAVAGLAALGLAAGPPAGNMAADRAPPPLIQLN
jgi:hypothetical protein